jgi:hypothetical protein
MNPMAREPNEHHTTRIFISPSTEVAGYLDDLAKLGIYGKTRSEVAKTLIAFQIERLVKDGILKIRG